MSEPSILVCTLPQAKLRARMEAEAPALARALRTQGADAVCVLETQDGMDWIDTQHASGWLRGAPMACDQFAARMHAAIAQGFVPADAAIIAKMRGAQHEGAKREGPLPLPTLSWGEQPPATPEARTVLRSLDLYAIVGSAERLRQVLDAGVRTVQLRIKQPASPDAAWHALLEREVREAIADSTASGAELFVNDHWKLAHALGATGVHLGHEDLLALGDDGREALLTTGMALGVSSHSLWELCRARVLAPRYIACGPVWATVTKDMPWLPQGLDNLAWWCGAADAPVTAIGGILEPQQVHDAARAGADGICIVRGLGDEPRLTVPRFQAALAAGRANPLPAAPAWPHPTLPHDVT